MGFSGGSRLVPVTIEQICRSVATSTSIETGEDSEAIYRRLMNGGCRFNIGLCSVDASGDPDDAETKQYEGTEP